PDALGAGDAQDAFPTDPGELRGWIRRPPRIGAGHQDHGGKFCGDEARDCVGFFPSSPVSAASTPFSSTWVRSGVLVETVNAVSGRKEPGLRRTRPGGCPMPGLAAGVSGVVGHGNPLATRIAP